MKKNVSGQIVGAQMIDAEDGSAFTGSVTCYVTGDGGTQAVGSVGSGACTHEGNGFHTYAPAQAETNYDHIAFTFIGSGAIPVTVQVYTSHPQSGDAYARLGAPSGASVSADIATVKGVADDIKAKTDNLPSDPADASDIASAFSSIDGKIDTIDNVVDAIKAKTDNLPSDPADQSEIDDALAALEAKLDSIMADIEPLYTGTLAAGAADSITLASDASDEEDFYKGCYVFIKSGPGAGQSGRWITASSDARVCTLNFPWALAPDDTSVVAIYDGGLLGETHDALRNGPLLPTDVKAINGTEVIGAGTSDNKWRPVS